MVFHVRTEQVLGEVGQRSFKRKLAIDRMRIDRAKETPQAGIARGMTRFHVKEFFGRGCYPALLNELVGRCPEGIQPVIRDEFLQQQISLIEIKLTLLLGEDLWAMGEDLFRFHSVSLCCGQAEAY